MTTVKDILNQYERFKIPRLDLEILIAKILDCSRTRLYSHPESKLTQKSISELNKLAKQRTKGKPIAYLTNTKEFYGLNFYIDERVLIPRPETELIIDQIKNHPLDELSILDIGTGSGAIGLTLSTKYKRSRTILVDICTDVLEVAKINTENFNLSDRVTLQESNLLDKLEPNQKFDIIATNLPYIGEETHNYASQETKKYEPSKALYAGKDGLDLYRRLFQEIKTKHIEFGVFIGEFGFGQNEIIQEELSKYFENYEIKEDLAGIPRIFIVR
jgi:release factor glutamine methyltransferase